MSDEHEVRRVALSALRPHPLNSNVMSETLLAKLQRHLETSGYYPPLIVRPIANPRLSRRTSSKTRGVDGDKESPRIAFRGLHVEAVPGSDAASVEQTYQVLDGHHRWRVLQRLGRREADCVVWDVDDEQAVVLLATLNRLQGQDDPKRRSALLAEVRDRLGKTEAELAKLLPERAEQVRRYLSFAEPVRLAPPQPMEQMPAAVHFFLSGADRRRLERVLEQIGPTRDAALMQLVELGEAQRSPREGER